jgi:hypothetical protein
MVGKRLVDDRQIFAGYVAASVTLFAHHGLP